MAFFFFLFYLIVLYIRPAEWIPLFQGMRLANLTLSATALFLCLRLVATRRGLVKVPHNSLLIGLLLAVALSHAAHTYIQGMLNALSAFAAVLIIYLLVVNTVTSATRLRVTFWLIILLTVVLAWQGIYQFQHGHGWAGQTMADGNRIRWISIFNDPNDLALTFVIVVPLLLAYLVKPGFLGLKIIPLSALALLLYGIFLTNSRGGVLGLMVSIAFFFIKRSRWVVPGLILGGILATAVFLFGPSRLSFLSATDESAIGRLDAWYYGFQLFKSSPIFGVGFNMFTDQYPLTAHNSFVLALAELGIVGLCCWVGLFYVSFKGLSRVERYYAPLAPYAYGLQAGIVGFMATAFFLSRTYNEIPYLICALSAALYAVAAQETDRVPFRFRIGDVRNVVLLSLGAMVLVQAAMKTWLR